MSDFSGLLNNEVFHRSLLACSIEIVLMTYSISCEYDPLFDNAVELISILWQHHSFS